MDILSKVQELLDIEERNDVLNLTRKERVEFEAEVIERIEEYNSVSEELKAYKDAEKQGLLHKAEIPDGTTIYVLQTDEDDQWFVHNESYLYGMTEYFYGQLGKDFWTSKEAAEQALAEMKGV